MRSLVILLVLATLPALAAATPTFEHDGVLGPGVPVARSEHEFRVVLAAGESVAATLTWSDADARLALRVGGRACDVLFDEGCATGPGAVPSCGAGEGAGTTRSLVLTALEDGAYVFSVSTALAAAPVPYHLSLGVDAARVTVHEGGGLTLPVTGAHCGL